MEIDNDNSCNGKKTKKKPLDLGWNRLLPTTSSDGRSPELMITTSTNKFDGEVHAPPQEDQEDDLDIMTKTDDEINECIMADIRRLEIELERRNILNLEKETCEAEVKQETFEAEDGNPVQKKKRGRSPILQAKRPNCLQKDGGDEEWCEDESSWIGSGIKSDPSSDLNREWQRRKSQFHAIGYRDGLIAGKEASAQIGFNVGFKESIIVGYNWGLVRGVTGALNCVPVELREKVIESHETSTKFHDLYESVNKLSTEDALKMFADDLSKRRIACGDKEGYILPGEEQKLEGSILHSYYGQLQSLIMESPAIDVQLRDKIINVSSTSQDPLLQ